MSSESGGLSRRTFVKLAAAAPVVGGIGGVGGAGAARAAAPTWSEHQVGGTSAGPELFGAPTITGKPMVGTIKIGLIGCGGRGTGAAVQALSADKDVVLHAMGDVFADRLNTSFKAISSHMDGEGTPAKVQVPPERRFVGFDAYQKVIDSGVDLVLLTTYPYFRPEHLRAVVNAGKHVFAEKPVAVDAPGIRSVLESAAICKQKGLACLVGFCWRYHDGIRGIMDRIHTPDGGGIGDVVTVYTNYLTETLTKYPRKPEWSDMEFQLRNWWHFTWLAGDHIVEQAIHSIDRLAWVVGDKIPTRVIGLGGRAARTGPESGYVFDHFSAIYEYDNGMRTFHSCRQIDGSANDNSDYVLGTKGRAVINGWVPTLSMRDLNDKEFWKYSGISGRDMYQNEHNALFASLRAGTPINDLERGTRSTMMAIMARMAAYTGQAITWEQAMESKEKLGPAKCDFGPIETPPVAVPGKTKFV